VLARSRKKPRVRESFILRPICEQFSAVFSLIFTAMLQFFSLTPPALAYIWFCIVLGGARKKCAFVRDHFVGMFVSYS